MTTAVPPPAAATMASSPSKQGRIAKPRATWYAFQKLKLIKTLSELNTPKYWARNGWNEEAWEIVQKSMKDCGYCFDYSVKQMKNQERALKKQYDTVKKLIRLNGFHWDKSQGKVLAHNELWNQLFEFDKRAEKWRRMQFPLYEELCNLYEGASPKQNCSQCANRASTQSSVCSFSPPQKLASVTKTYDQSSSSSEESFDTDYSEWEAEFLKTMLLDDFSSKMILLNAFTTNLMIDNIWWQSFAGTKAEKPQKVSLEKKYSVSECMMALNASSGFTSEEKFKAANFLKERIVHEFLARDMDERVTGKVHVREIHKDRAP